MSAFTKSRAPVAGSAASEHYAPTEHDSNDERSVSVHDSLPAYERHPFPRPILEKGGYTLDPPLPADARSVGFGRSGFFHRKSASASVASGPTSTAGSIRTANMSAGTGPRAPQGGAASSRHISMDSDTIIAPNSQAKLMRNGTWAHGPATSGREESALRRGQSLHQRATEAAHYMDEKERMMLSKAEIKDAEKLSKIIKAEGKAEDKALKAALKELDSIQRAQKKASAKETEAVTIHTRAAKEEHAASRAYLEAKARFERAQSNLKVTEERMELARGQAERTTQMLKRQADEVEALRERKATDDRERAVKLANLRAGMLSQQKEY